MLPLVRDRDIGIKPEYQYLVNETVFFSLKQYNEDDRETTSTKMQRGMIQTLKDLHEALAMNQMSESQPSSEAYSYTQ